MRNGDWISTFSGRRFFITDPHPDDVTIGDIAHGLSMLCRFGGQVRYFYSVAQHSVLVAERLERLYPKRVFLHLLGLLHDTPEAYLGEVVKPLKVKLPEYAALEARMMETILVALNLPPTMSPADKKLIKDSDNALLATERRDLINHSEKEWKEEGVADPMIPEIKSLYPPEAEALFLNTYRRLMTKVVAAGARSLR